MFNPFAAIPVRVVTAEEIAHKSQAFSPKFIGSTVGGILATILWFLLVRFVPAVKQHLDAAAITSITGATGTLFAALLGYFVADRVRTLSTH